MFTANRIEKNHDSKIVQAPKNNCTCFKHLLCQPRKTRLQERQKKTHRVPSNTNRPSGDIAEPGLESISIEDYATLEPHRQDCTRGRRQTPSQESFSPKQPTAHQAGREHYVVEAVLLAQGRDDGANQGPPALIPRPRGNPGVAQDPSGCGSTTQAWKHFRWTARRLGSSEGLRNAYYVLERVHKKRALRLFNEQHVLRRFTCLFEGMTAED